MESFAKDMIRKNAMNYLKGGSDPEDPIDILFPPRR